MYRITTYRVAVALSHLFWVSLLAAQPRFEQAVVIDKTKGLPVNDVRAICKDSAGFIWIGTYDGLCRFDGTRFKTYRNIPGDTTSLFENQVNDVQAFRGCIWAATNMGLSVLDPRTEKFTHYQFDSTGTLVKPRRAPRRELFELYLSPAGELWLGTQNLGVARYRPEHGDFQFFPVKDPAALARATATNSALRILSIEASKTNDSILYAGTHSGLEEINRHSGQVRWYTFPQPTPEAEIATNAFRRLYFHDDGLLYVGTWRAGMQVFDPRKKTLTPLPVSEGPGLHLLQAGIRRLLRKSSHEIWVSAGMGLGIYDTERRAITYWKFNDIRRNIFYSIDLIDEHHRAWSSQLNGLNVYDPCLQQFAEYEYAHLRPPGWSYTFYIEQGLAPDELVIMPRADNGIYRFNRKTGDWQRFPLEVPGMKTPESWVVRGFDRAPDGSYTISADHGLFTYTPETRRTRRLVIPSPLSRTAYGPVLWDATGQLWISAGTDGLLCWNPAQRRTRVFCREFAVAGSGTARPQVFEMFEDSRRQLWIRREDGFSVYLPARDTILNFTYSQLPERSFPEINTFCEDRLGRIWMTGKDGWIGYADIRYPELGVVKKINLRAEKGMTEVQALAADPAGDIWGYTNQELFSIRVDSLSINRLSFDYGVKDVDFFSFQFAPDGQLVIGGRNRIFLFDPAGRKRNPELPKPYIEEIQVQGKPLPAIPVIDGQPGLHLRYWENFFSFNFSAIAYTLGHKCRFRYRLEGFQDWTEAGERRYASYTNVPGGQYFFEVQVANNEGKWNPAALRFPVWVDTAWWETWWLRSAALLLVLSLVYGVYRYRIVQIRRQERLRGEFEKQLANVEMSALRAQMNPHFLFNSLNSIDSYIIRNETKKASEYLNNFARLIRLILHNSRTNYTSLKDELETIDLYLQMESLRFKDKFEYTIQVAGGLDTASINIPPMLIQPYLENAIWHGLMHKDGGGGQLRVQVEQSGENLVCMVEDNGVGRARAAELNPKRAGKNRQSMGMKITEDRIEIINKLYGANTRVQVIDLYDEAGEGCGTRVVLTIPI